MIRAAGGGAECGALNAEKREVGDPRREAGPENEAPDDVLPGVEMVEPSAVASQPDNEAPVGPSEGEEAVFLAEQRAIEPADVARANGAEAPPEEPAGPLPALEDLVSRIPAPTRTLLDELFRAKFVAVKRVPKDALK